VTRLAQLDFERRDDVVVARIAGELDLSNVHDIGDALNAAVTSDVRGLVLDLSALDHLDSAGVRLIFDLRSRLATARQQVTAVVPDGAPIREILELAAVPATVPVFASLAQAVAAAGAR
jgi:stage II sporulation protein AA (anti-sigma F factor antagonist)